MYVDSWSDVGDVNDKEDNDDDEDDAVKEEGEGDNRDALTGQGEDDKTLKDFFHLRKRRRSGRLQTAVQPLDY